MPFTLKPLLGKIIKEKAPGPLPSFSIFHAVLAIELISEKSVGRNKLAEDLGIGEGAVRTLISKLKDAGLISTSKTGCALTEKGLTLWKEYRSTLRKARIHKNELTFAQHSFAVLVKNSGHKVKTGMEQRDAAVMTGAKSATTLLFKKGHLVFPSVNRDIEKDFPNASTQVMNLLKPRENDVVIVVSSDDSQRAEYSALAAAWTLLDNSQ